MVRLRGCHLVGSVPLQNAEDVFRYCVDALPRRLERLPDGETGHRIDFTSFQKAVLPDAVLARPSDGAALSAIERAATLQQLETTDIATHYDDEALASYESFNALRAKGTISQDIKFQVSLPTIANVVGVFVTPSLQAAVEPHYEKALFRSLARIQNFIPHKDLAIQIDLGMDLSFWDGLFLKPWFEDRLYVVEYIIRMIDQIENTVDIGLHFCYGMVQKACRQV